MSCVYLLNYKVIIDKNKYKKSVLRIHYMYYSTTTTTTTTATSTTVQSFFENGEIKKSWFLWSEIANLVKEVKWFRKPRWHCRPCPCHAASHGLLCRLHVIHFMLFLSIPPPYWLHDFEPLGVHFDINLVIHVQLHSYHSQHLRRHWLQNAPTPTTLPLVFSILSPHTTVGTMLCKHSHL